MLNVIALAQYAAASTRSWAVNSPIARQRLKAENDQLRQEVALLTEEIRIKDERMKRVSARRRATLDLRVCRGSGRAPQRLGVA